MRSKLPPLAISTELAELAERLRGPQLVTDPTGGLTDRIARHTAAFDAVREQFDIVERLGLNSLTADIERSSQIGDAVQNLTRSFDAPGLRIAEEIGRSYNIARYGEALGLSSTLGDAIREQAERTSALNERLQEIGASWRSVSDVLRISQLDELGLASTVGKRLIEVPPSVFGADPSEDALVGFAHLVHLERASAEHHPFSGRVRELYEEEFGDPVEFDEDDTADERREATRRSGFNDELTAFAPGQQVVVVTRAGFEFLSLADLPVGTDDIGGVASYHASADHVLKLLEREFRDYIARTLKRVAGPGWSKQRVPGDMRKNWMKRRQAALDAGQPECPLILYADFMDLPQLIVRGDNWRDAFQHVFRNKADVEVSFERMHPMRLAIAHVRPVLEADVTMLAGEAMRMLRAIGRG